MQLTTAPAPVLNPISPARRIWALATIATATGGIFTLDYLTVDAPVQHLYYLPIMMAGLLFGLPGSLSRQRWRWLCTTLQKNHGWERCAMVRRISFRSALFFAVGLITAKLAGATQKNAPARNDGRPDRTA